MTPRRDPDPLVSVITPVYNGERYLHECIDSVIAQTYRNWEYVIVNNGSTDRTLDIAHEYAARDGRIRVHDNDAFVRVIENHNIAFRQISPASTYCKPLSADDMLLPECLSQMVALAEAHPTVGIVGAYGLYSDPNKGVYCSGVPYSTPVVSGRELARGYLLGKGPSVFGAPTFMMFRSDVVRSRDAFYNESNIHADSEACLAVMENHDFGFVQQILTFTRVRDESLTSLSESLGTHLPYELYALKTYGAKFLSAEELQHQLRARLADYYKFLAWQTTKRRGADFWNYHRKMLATLGYPLSIVRLSRHALSRALDLALNPKTTAAKAARRLRQRSRRSGRDRDTSPRVSAG